MSRCFKALGVLVVPLMAISLCGLTVVGTPNEVAASPADLDPCADCFQVTSVPAVPDEACIVGDTSINLTDHSDTDCFPWTMVGYDDVYCVFVPRGCELIVKVFPGSWDPGIYVTDCSGYYVPCILGIDDYFTSEPETLHVPSQPIDRTEYIVVDSFSTSSLGAYEVCFSLYCPSAAAPRSWGEIKSIFK